MKFRWLLILMFVTTLGASVRAETWKTTDVEINPQASGAGDPDSAQILELPKTDIAEPAAPDSPGAATPDASSGGNQAAKDSQPNATKASGSAPANVGGIQDYQANQATADAAGTTQDNSQYGSISDYMNQQNDVNLAPGVPMVVLIPFGGGVQYYRPRPFCQRPYFGGPRGLGGGHHR